MKTWVDWALRLALILGVLIVAAMTREWQTCIVLVVLAIVLANDAVEIHLKERRLELQDELLALTQAENLALKKRVERASKDACEAWSQLRQAGCGRG